MAEIRTTSSTGGQKGVKPERHSLMPRPGLDAIARVFGFGATKYDSHNWRKGYEWSKSYDALVRHITAFWDGETLDPESGLPHLAHAGFHVLVLLTWLEEQGEGSEFDDRYRPALEEALGTISGQSIMPCDIQAGSVTIDADGFSWGNDEEVAETLRFDLLTPHTLTFEAKNVVDPARTQEDVRRMTQRSFDRRRRSW